MRNGSRQSRQIQIGAGALKVSAPRIDDRRDGHRFTSLILPPYVRRSPSLENLIPLLYLKGISTSDMSSALEPLLGTEATRNLSAANIAELKKVWQKEYSQWGSRNLAGKEYVYLWADAIYFNVRLTDERPCVLVVVGSLPDGTKEVVAIEDGERESKLSWKSMLRDLIKRGLKKAPKLATGDGALGFWAALREVFPETRQQRCWVHKTANVLDKLPRKVQPKAKGHLHEIYMAQSRKDALAVMEEFQELYAAKYPKAWQCLEKDQEALLSFYDFPAEHWGHIRSTNAIESTFATIRHRTRQTKGCGSREATLAMICKLAMEAERGWRRLRGYKLLAKVVEGIAFRDGIEVKKAA